MAILDTAEAYWRSIDYTSGALADGSGNGHDAQLGSAAGADSNDPVFLPYVAADGKYCYFPGVSGNQCSAPDAAAVSITGDLELVARIAPADWTPSLDLGLVSKWESAKLSYIFRLMTTGVLNLVVSGNGTTVLAAVSSTVATGFADGAAKWVKVTRKASDGKVNFYTAADQATEPGSWTQLGTEVTGTSGNIADTTALVHIGLSAIDAFYFTGKIYRAIIRSGIGGTTAFDANFNNATEPYSTFTESSANAATVTFNRSATGRKLCVVERNVFLLGTDDYLTAPDHANLDFAGADSFTVVALLRAYGSQERHLLCKKAGTADSNVGWRLTQDTTKRGAGNIADGTNGTTDNSGTALSDGVLGGLAAVRDTGADTLKAYTDANADAGTTDATTGTLANALALEVGRIGTTYGDFEFFGAAVFRSVLTVTQLEAVRDELLGLAYEATAAVSVGAATCSGSATFTKPTYSATAAVSVGAATCSGAGTFTKPTYSGTAAVSAGGASCAGSATFTKPTYSGAAAVTIWASVGAGSATFSQPVYSGAAAVSAGPATALGVATFTKPTYSGSAAVSVGGAAGSGSALFTKPTYSGSAAVTAAPVMAAGAATFGPGSRVGAAAVTIGRVVGTGTATFTAPPYVRTTARRVQQVSAERVQRVSSRRVQRTSSRRVT
jgi:hypothetical protein